LPDIQIKINCTLKEYYRKVNSKSNFLFILDKIPEIKHHCPICGGKDCVQFIGFYHRRVVDEYGCVMDDFPIARFLCRKKGNPPRGSHRTFSVLPLELIPYTKYSIVFIFKVLRLLYISGMSVMELQTLLSRALCGDIQYIDLSTYAVGAFKKLLREAILKFFSLGFYTGREHELSSVDPPHRAVRLIEFALDFETFKTTPPIRGPTALDYDFYLQGGGYMQNAYFLMGSPSQFR